MSKPGQDHKGIVAAIDAITVANGGTASGGTITQALNTLDVTLGGSGGHESISDALYALRSVVAPKPTGNKSITANGTDIDVAEYATVSVAVPNPSTGTLQITANGTGIDVKQYAYVDVAVE